MFRKTLELLPEPGPNQPYYNMLRWGANANLGRIYEAKKDHRRAIAYQTQRDPTSQYVGNLLRARELVWSDPMAAAVSLPPAPRPSRGPEPGRANAPPAGGGRPACSGHAAGGRTVARAAKQGAASAMMLASISPSSRAALSFENSTTLTDSPESEAVLNRVQRRQVP